MTSMGRYLGVERIDRPCVISVEIRGTAQAFFLPFDYDLRSDFRRAGRVAPGTFR